MDPIAASHAQLLPATATLIRRAIDGVSDDDLHRAPEPGGNSMLWIVAHLVAMRIGVFGMLGATMPRPEWAASFVRGSGAPPREAYPAPEALLALLDQTALVLAARLDAMTDAEWSAPAPRKLPVGDGSMRGALVFAAFHEAYHVGQLAYLRKWLGHGGLVG